MKCDLIVLNYRQPAKPYILIAIIILSPGSVHSLMLPVNFSEADSYFSCRKSIPDSKDWKPLRVCAGWSKYAQGFFQTVFANLITSHFQFSCISTCGKVPNASALRGIAEPEVTNELYRKSNATGKINATTAAQSM